MMKKKLLIVGSIILVAICVISLNNQLIQTMFPWQMRAVFNYDTKPVEIRLGDTVMRIPKAYFIRDIQWHDNDTVITPITLRASWKDDFKPWTLSESFKKRDRSAAMNIMLYRKNPADHLKKRLSDVLNTNYKLFPEKKEEIDQGVYLNKFNRYHTFSLLANKPYFTSVILIPFNTEKQYWLNCSSDMKPAQICNVGSLGKDGSYYAFNLRIENLQDFEKVDKKIQKLIDTFIVKENR